MYNQGVILNKRFVGAALFSFFALAFVVSPYWTLPRSYQGKFLLLVVTVAAGLVWSYQSSGSFSITFSRKDFLAPSALFLVLAVFNAGALTAGIPWQGDESYHIYVTQSIAHVWVPPFALIVLLVLCLSWKFFRWGLFLGTVTIAGASLFFIAYNPIPQEDLLRYPFFTRWFHAVGPLLAKSIHVSYNEAFYRVVPFIAAVIVAWACRQRVVSGGRLLSYAWGSAAATMPIMFYYSSILYLELPAVALMLFVCLGIKDLLRDDFDALVRDPCWYGLIITGFIKETAIIFLLSFLFCRAVVRCRGLAAGAAVFKKAVDEVKVIFCTLFPVVYYIFLRQYAAAPRRFTPEISGLLSSDVYRALLQACIDQFGLFCILFVSGCIVLWKKKERGTLLFLLITCTAVPLFFALDNMGFAGYSRFNLFTVPPLLAGSFVFVDFAGRKKRILSFMVVLMTIGANILLSPVNSDGTKKPYWGNYLCDTSEHYYPYEEALVWLKEHYGSRTIMFAGMSFPYYFDFYCNKLDWYPSFTVLKSGSKEDDAAALRRSLREAEKKGCAVVVFHVRRDAFEEINDTTAMHGYGVLKIFKNQAHALIVFSKQKGKKNIREM